MDIQKAMHISMALHRGFQYRDIQISKGSYPVPAVSAAEKMENS